jgi:hypothetical protein
LHIVVRRRFLYGNFGVGKTISLILYAELMRHISAYKQLAAKDEAQLNRFKKLQAGRFILTQRRVVYLSIAAQPTARFVESL